MASEGKITKNLSHLSIEEKKQFFDSFDMVQTDCDGVLWLLGDVFPGVEKAIQALRTIGKRVVFVSNNSSRTMDDYRAKVIKLTDHTVEDGDIIHPAKIVIEYLREQKFDALCYVIGSSNFKSCLREAGFQVLDGPDNPVNESAKEVIATINDKQPVKAVIVDFDYNCNNIKLLRAQLYLQQGACFIVGAINKVIPLSPEMRLIGPGWYVDILRNTTKRKPIVLGKPSPDMSRLVKRMYKIDDPQRVLFVGDQPEMDVKFGHISNFQTLLVGTGGVKEEDLVQNFSCSDETPDFYIRSFADLDQIVREVVNYKTNHEM
ncbi:uncharacterized protein LOC128724058 [Anopheles nili]|uniref:uncharacterized protein LOC128724058 n=1 Tax=Anopheles nili TaxID=185578 RepID=UPI00237B0984|nr:uncharacterized protein LOC128724058 [Anopheles nili]